MNAPQINHYSHPREFLLAYYNYLKNRDRHFSIRTWSRDLGYRHHGYLANVLRGQRSMTSSLVQRLVKNQQLTQPEAKKLELMCIYFSPRCKNKENLDHILEQIKTSKNFLNLEASKFHIIRDWFYLPILEMLNLKNFQEDPAWISKRLASKVTPLQVEIALSRLLKLGLINRDQNKKLHRTDKDLFFGNDLPQESIVEHHEQFLRKGIDALHQQSVQNRDISGTNVAIELKDFSKVKQYIREFQEKIHGLASNRADEVYHINIQAFRLTATKERDL